MNEVPDDVVDGDVKWKWVMKWGRRVQSWTL